MNRAADQDLRDAALEWIKRSPAAAASLVVWDGKGELPVFVAIGTEPQLRQVAPDDFLAAAREAVEAIGLVLVYAGNELKPDLRRQLERSHRRMAYWAAK